MGGGRDKAEIELTLLPRVIRRTLSNGQQAPLLFLVCEDGAYRTALSIR